MISGPGLQGATEADLCGIYGVSRTTIREAVKRLHGKGLIEGEPRNGTRVLPTAREGQRGWNAQPRGNWRWRLTEGALTDGIRDRLKRLAELYGRSAAASATGLSEP